MVFHDLNNNAPSMLPVCSQLALVCVLGSVVLQNEADQNTEMSTVHAKFMACSESHSRLDPENSPRRCSDEQQQHINRCSSRCAIKIQAVHKPQVITELPVAVPA